MNRSNIGLAGKVKKRYTGIDLDNDREVVNAMYGDISTVEGSLEYLKNYAESLGYEVKEVWRKRGRYERPKKRPNTILLVKNSVSDAEDDYNLKNFIVEVYFCIKSAILTVNFGIGFSYFEDFYKNERPKWWWNGGTSAINNDIEEKYGRTEAYLQTHLLLQNSSHLCSL